MDLGEDSLFGGGGGDPKKRDMAVKQRYGEGRKAIKGVLVSWLSLCATRDRAQLYWDASKELFSMCPAMSL